MLAIGFWLLTPTLALSLTAAQDTEDVLGEKGLRLSANVYVLPEEKELQNGMQRIVPLQRAVTVAQREVNAHNKTLEDNKKWIKQALAEHIRLTNQLQNLRNNTDASNIVVSRLNALVAEIELRRKSDDPDDATKAVRAKLSKARESYVEVVLNMRQAVDKARKVYKELATDTAVAAAIAEAGKDAEKAYALGPSKAFENGVKRLEKLEETVLTDNIQLVREGDTWGIEVVLNEKHSKTMIFDTGASKLSLPAALAREIGLTPNSETQSVEVRIADGNTVQGWLMKVDSVRVGKFEAKDVDCVVMPPHLRNVPALLGGAFLNNFSYRMDPDTGRLHMSQVDGGDAKTNPKSAARKATPKKK